MKRKTKMETVSVPLTEKFSPLNAVEMLRRLNAKLNEDILPVAVNSDQIELYFQLFDEYGDNPVAYFEFERWETDEEFELRKSDAKAKKNATRLKAQQAKDAERAEYERLKKIYG